MSAFAAIGVANQASDWLLAGFFLALCYLVLYPLYVTYLRSRHARRIQNQLVTSQYKLPVQLTPTELGYIFSTKVMQKQLYATLLDLANRSVIILSREGGHDYAEMGPKLDGDLKAFEKLLVGHIHAAQEKIAVANVIEGMTNYRLSDGNTVQGSRQYVFWWLLRDSLRKRKIIEPRMIARYFRMLGMFAVIGGLAVAIIPLVTWRFICMLRSGEVDFAVLGDNITNGAMLWLTISAPLVLVCFFILRFKGRMLGRRWLITDKYSRYLGQIDGYREFVRLAHADKLRFESKELKKDTLAATKPYAIALGYVKP